MQRAISRVFRGHCRKFRENDCPVAAGEEVRRNSKNEDNKNGFIPPKHSLEEAVTWTTGLVLGYQLTHRRRRALIEECPPVVASTSTVSTLGNGLNSISSFDTIEKHPSHCPFSLASKVFSQPIFSRPSSVLSVTGLKTNSASTVISSIDVTPFIHDEAQDSELPDRLNTPSTVVEDDDIVFAFESSDVSKQVTDEDLVDRIPDNPAEYGIKFGADLLSVLGAFEFLHAEAKAKTSGHFSPQSPKNSLQITKESRAITDPDHTATSNFNSRNVPVHAMELMKRGADLGSARAVYNIGVAYERLNDPLVAREYYKQAADLGHPLATYNCAVFALRDGHLAEGYALMKTASDFGVPEAEEFMKPSGNSLALQAQVGKV